MKLSVSQLRRIIKEEVSNLIMEANHPPLSSISVEDYPGLAKRILKMIDHIKIETDEIGRGSYGNSRLGKAFVSHMQKYSAKVQGTTSHTEDLVNLFRKEAETLTFEKADGSEELLPQEVSKIYLDLADELSKTDHDPDERFDAFKRASGKLIKLHYEIDAQMDPSLRTTWDSYEDAIAEARRRTLRRR